MIQEIRPASYWHGWEINKESRWVRGLKNQDGEICTSDEQVAERFAAYYADLYKIRSQSNPLQIEEYLASVSVPVLAAEDRNGLEEEITLTEVQDAILKLKAGKSPGPNGIPAEVYKRFPDLLGPHILGLFLGAREEGHIPPDLWRATIAVIHKQGKPRESCDSYRPISLLNIEVKILATVLATRLLRVILSLVHIDQSGFMPGRSTRFNLRRVHNWLAEIEDRETPTCSWPWTRKRRLTRFTGPFYITH